MMEDMKALKILVIGTLRREKTSFIHDFYEEHSPGGIHYDSKAMVYECQLDIKGEPRRVLIFDIPADDIYRAEHLLIMHSDGARFILTYFMDDPSSFRLLVDLWSSMMFYERNLKPVIVVGLKTEQEVEKSLEVDSESPDEESLESEKKSDKEKSLEVKKKSDKEKSLESEKKSDKEESLENDNKHLIKRENAESSLSNPNIKKFFECSTENLKEINEAFTFLLNCELA